ncbi:hypothetical protein M5689_010473 [Euphorbia peplus]|nr:hypothetical protein M5689_010473 [Euphorbia peplus]
MIHYNTAQLLLLLLVVLPWLDLILLRLTHLSVLSFQFQLFIYHFPFNLYISLLFTGRLDNDELNRFLLRLLRSLFVT